MAPTNSKSTPKPKPIAKAKNTQIVIQKATLNPKLRRAKFSKAKSTRARRFKPNSFFGIPTELRQLILSYTYTDQDMEKSILRRYGAGRYAFGSHCFMTENLRDRALLLMDVDPKVKKEMQFVSKKWLHRGRELASAKYEGK